ncbi:MAG TPA: Spo0E family sporulation regulatory protein-aspartic acid phosphatase [Clostridiales bacterium]|nr:Spo0E family sporulation regulatory protein-aspartic acid phosphatase [Clostridiales bacterium]
MKEKQKIEMIKNILHNAISMNVNKNIILKISQQLDEYIINYYRKNEKPNGCCQTKKYE